LRQMRSGLPHRRALRKKQSGHRLAKETRLPLLPERNARGHPMSKPTLATIWLDGCSGCHMSFLDIDERILQLDELADIVCSPIVDRKTFPDAIDITLVEGSVSTNEDEHKILLLRSRTRTLVALGDCAVTGNVPAMRNVFPLSSLFNRAYVETATHDPQTPTPHPRNRSRGHLRPRLPALRRHHLHRPHRPPRRTRTRHRRSDAVRSLEKRPWEKPSPSTRSPASKATQKSPCRPTSTARSPTLI